MAPFLGMFHLLLERSPPRVILDAKLDRADLALTHTRAGAHAIQRIRIPRPGLFGSGLGRARCGGRGPHQISQ